VDGIIYLPRFGIHAPCAVGLRGACFGRKIKIEVLRFMRKIESVGGKWTVREGLRDSGRKIKNEAWKIKNEEENRLWEQTLE